MKYTNTDDTDLFIVETATEVLESLKDTSLGAYYQFPDEPKRDCPDGPALFPRIVDQDTFAAVLRRGEARRGEERKQGMGSGESLALVLHAGINDSLSIVVTRVLAKHVLCDRDVGEKATQLMIQRTAHQWAKQFSVLDLRASSCPDLKCLTTLMEHDVQVMRWKQAPRGSMAEADAVKREREAFDKLNVQYTQMGGDLVRMFPTVRVVAEAIGQTLDRKLENAMAALREISSARALVAHEYEPSADELGHQPASGHLDILPVRVMAKKTEGEADQSDERNQIVAQAKTRRAVP